MDATVIIAVIVVVGFVAILVTLHHWGKRDDTRQDAITEDIVRVLTGPVQIGGALNARLPRPNSTPPPQLKAADDDPQA